jgi:hypothetical protein
MQCAPLSSGIGFTDTGTESAHCHHAAASFLNASASTAACIGASPVTGPIATIQRSIEGFMKTSRDAGMHLPGIRVAPFRHWSVAAGSSTALAIDCCCLMNAS